MRTAKEKVVLHSRREVVQHAAAFQHMTNAFVKQDMPMSERLVKETQGILVEGLGTEDAGVFNLHSFGGTYRHGNQKAYAGTHEYTRRSESHEVFVWSEVWKQIFSKLREDQGHDPFMLGAQHCG